MYAVVMAGGSGTRFWPASRERLPKQFLKITGDRTMLEETLERIRPVVSDERIYVVVGTSHADVTEDILRGTAVRAIVEPFARNTAPCIGLAAVHAARRGLDEPMIVLPADHFVADRAGFVETIRAAAEASRGGAIVTLGIVPTRPETGYGYVRVGAEAGSSHGTPYFSVERFVEKPDAATAIEYLASGRYLWNSGIFIFTPRTILAEIERCAPALGAALRDIGEALGTSREVETVRRVYESIESISVDYAVMERTTAPIYVFKADFGWSDVGSWQALRDLRAAGDEDVVVGDAVSVDSARNLVFSTTDRVVALVGVEGLVVADTPDALLVATLERSQDVKKVIDRLRAEGRAGVC